VIAHEELQLEAYIARDFGSLSAETVSPLMCESLEGLPPLFLQVRLDRRWVFGPLTHLQTS
jgi:hypothetical protein